MYISKRRCQDRGRTTFVCGLHGEFASESDHLMMKDLSNLESSRTHMMIVIISVPLIATRVNNHGAELPRPPWPDCHTKHTTGQRKHRWKLCQHATKLCCQGTMASEPSGSHDSTSMAVSARRLRNGCRSPNGKDSQARTSRLQRPCCQI